MSDKETKVILDFDTKFENAKVTKCSEEQTKNRDKPFDQDYFANITTMFLKADLDSDKFLNKKEYVNYYYLYQTFLDEF